jgi:hypothetical protein
MVRCIATGNYKTIAVSCRNISHACISLYRKSGLAGINKTAHGAYDDHLGTGFFEPIIRVPEFKVIIDCFHQDKDSFAC